MELNSLENYLNRMDLEKAENEQHNKTTYEQARELSAWLSIAKHGAEPYKTQAIRIISKF